MGASRAGLDALGKLLEGLPADFPAPIALVLHRPASSMADFSEALTDHYRLPVADARDKDRLMPGHVYVAPAGYHLLVERGGLALSTEASVNHARPSLDVLFDSAAAAYGSEVACVVLSGTGHDGAAGTVRLKRAGAVVLVQDPAEAGFAEMPAAAIAATAGAEVRPVAAIAQRLTELCHAAQRRFNE
jgi:two-component system chemotaxis response regulator CheB